MNISDVEARGEDDITPLHHAARYKQSSKKKETPSGDEEDEVSINRAWF